MSNIDKNLEDFFKVEYRKKGEPIDISSLVEIAEELDILEEENKRRKLYSGYSVED